MIHLSGGSGKGSCRSYGGFNLFNALEACSDLLVSFGGHELAAGFTIEERNIPAFRTRMNQYVRAHTGEHPPVSMLDVDVDLQHPSLITLEEVEALSLLEPYGAGNNRPVFCLRGAPSGRVVVDVTPATAGWTHVGFKALRLGAGDEESLATGARELCITVLSGQVDVHVGAHVYRALGSRASVFEEASPTAVYVPPDRAVRIVARGAAEVALSSAPARGVYPERVIEPAQMQRSVRGQGSNTRYVCDILPQSQPAEGLLVVEVITPAGHSSSYPPHKHDSADASQPQAETVLEETYYHQLNPAQGFAFQRVYTDDRSLDESMAVERRDTVMVPRGYHPCVAPHGYDLYYLNTMAGPERRWAFKNDPAHAWMAAPR